MFSLALVIAWLAFGVPAYFLLRRQIRQYGEWTVGDRWVAMVLSLAGPIMLAATLLSPRITTDERSARW